MAYSFCISTLKPVPPRTYVDVDRFNLRLHEEVEIFGEIYDVPAARLTAYSHTVSDFNETLI